MSSDVPVLSTDQDTFYLPHVVSGCMKSVNMFSRLSSQLYKGRINATSHLIQHPMYGAGHKYRTLHLPISTTLAEVLDRVSGTFG